MQIGRKVKIEENGKSKFESNNIKKWEMRANRYEGVRGEASVIGAKHRASGAVQVI